MTDDKDLESIKQKNREVIDEALMHFSKFTVDYCRKYSAPSERTTAKLNELIDTVQELERAQDRAARERGIWHYVLWRIRKYLRRVSRKFRMLKRRVLRSAKK